MSEDARWLFRVSSHPAAGAGHVMRCSVLAHAVGANIVTFVLDSNGQHWGERLLRQGFQVIFENSFPSARWAGSVLDVNMPQSGQSTNLCTIAPPLVVIADHMNPPPGTSLFVNSAPGLTGSSVRDVDALLGTDFALLDPRFTTAARPITTDVQHIVVSFGGVDSGNATARVVNAMAHVQWPEKPPRCTIVMGSRSVHLQEIKANAAKCPFPAQVVVDTEDMPALLHTADLAIGAGGVSLLERMAAGMPSLTIRTADNQTQNIDGAARHGATLYVGKRDEVTEQQISHAIWNLVTNRDKRAELARQSRLLVDGNGAARVAKAMAELSDSMPSQQLCET